MNLIESLPKFGFSTTLIKEWQNLCHELLPLQQELIESGMLFSERHILVHAPTSAGKTFLAELAMVHACIHGGKAVYLVPLRVQAEEMFQTLRERYERYGLQILISTRDHRQHDSQLEQGRFHIAVVVYEKMLQVIARQPSLLGRVEMMVFDDIDLIFDFERGMTADFLLTRCLGTPSRCIALSACLPKYQQIADWMKAKLVHSEIRPVPLHKGVLYNGTFYYSDPSNNHLNEETLSNPSEIFASPLLHAAQALTSRGESCLIFMKSRYEVRSFAKELADYLNLHCAEESCQRLKSSEPTRARDALLHTLQHGVGFHYSDLLTDERFIVEEAFRKGEIRVLVATSTLAKGLNLPVDNVFISHEKWLYSDRNGNGENVPLSLSEFENMAGRAGRYGYRNEPSRAILIASTEEEKERLLSWYIEQSISPAFLPNDIPSIGPHTFSIIASYQTVTMEQVETFFKSSWHGWESQYNRCEQDSFQAWTKNWIDFAVRKGFCVMKNLHHFSLTPRGQLVATKGVSTDTVEQLEQWLNVVRGRDWDELDALFICALTPDGWLPQFELSTSEVQSKIYLDLLKQSHIQTPWDVMTPLQKFLQGLVEPNLREVKALKVAFVLREWICGSSFAAIEDNFAVSAGQVVLAGLRIAWILDALSQLAELMFIDNANAFRLLSEQVRHGLPAELLPLARQTDGLLTHSQMLTLHRAGISTCEQIASSTIAELRKYLPENIIPLIKQQSRKTKYKKPVNISIPSTNTKTNTVKITSINKEKEQKQNITIPELQCRPTKEKQFSESEGENKQTKNSNLELKKILLSLDIKRPGEVWVEGKLIRLPEKQYRLLYLLAQHTGGCVSYEEIYKELWDDIIVEDSQMAFQKCMLLQQLCKVSTHWKKYIRTIPKRGFLLDLSPEQISIN